MGRVLDVGKRKGIRERLPRKALSDRIRTVSQPSVGSVPLDRHRGEGNRIPDPENPPLPDPHPVSINVQRLGHRTDANDNPAGGNGPPPRTVATGGKQHLPPILGDPFVPDPLFGQEGGDLLPHRLLGHREVGIGKGKSHQSRESQTMPLPPVGPAEESEKKGFDDTKSHKDRPQVKTWIPADWRTAAQSRATVDAFSIRSMWFSSLA